MTSANDQFQPWQLRVLQEKIELEKRLEALRAFQQKQVQKDVLLDRQEVAMCVYVQVLQERIESWEVSSKLSQDQPPFNT